MARSTWGESRWCSKLSTYLDTLSSAAAAADAAAYSKTNNIILISLWRCAGCRIAPFAPSAILAKSYGGNGGACERAQANALGIRSGAGRRSHVRACVCVCGFSSPYAGCSFQTSTFNCAINCVNNSQLDYECACVSVQPAANQPAASQQFPVGIEVIKCAVRAGRKRVPCSYSAILKFVLSSLRGRNSRAI